VVEIHEIGRRSACHVITLSALFAPGSGAIHSSGTTPSVAMVDDGAVHGYGPSSYGDAFADVYDDWYRDVSDIEATVAALHALSQGGRVLELGVGTGRLALPLAARGCQVTGIDSSERMLERLASHDPHRTIQVVHGDMVDDLPTGPYDVVFSAYNTLFNLLSAERQQQCLARSRAVLAPGGRVVVEAFVPHPHTGSQVSVRSMSADRVVLSASVHHAADQRAEGQFIEFTEGGGVRLRPWAVRYTHPHELDALAAEVGLQLQHRWADFTGTAFDDSSEQHVSIYRVADAA